MTTMDAATDAGDGHGGTPQARTLDEATLRQVFPDAPQDLSVPRDVRSLFAARMRALAPRYGALAVLAAIASGLLALFVLANGGGGPSFLVLVPIVALVAGVAALQYSRASQQFFDSYAAARGLQLERRASLGANVPIFRRGDKRRWPLLMHGVIAGQRASVGHYTCTEITTDSEGRRQEHDEDFTVLHFELPHAVASRYRGVYCRPRSLSLGGLQDKLAHDRAVQLESAEFARRYSLRVVDEQDDVALYELFSPPFVQRLATELHVHWEQCGRDLVIWAKGHETEASDLDRMCLEGWHVLHRYLEEYR